MKIALAQVNSTVGDFQGNREIILTNIRQAQEKGVDLLLFPEMVITGYPAGDLLQKSGFVEEQYQVLLDIAKEVRQMTVVLGYVEPRKSPQGPLHNSLAVLENGKIQTRYHKKLLPSYDVFDEKRYFSPGKQTQTITLQNHKIALSICEDIWNLPGFTQFHYPENPLEEIAQEKPDILINLSASPFHVDKVALRHRLLSTIAQQYQVTTLYMNMVGGNDSIIFDGHSMVVDSQGHVKALGKSFEEDFIVYDHPDTESISLDRIQQRDQDNDAWNALVLGLRDYARKCGFSKALIGLSGGIDSALTACLAVEALGKDQVWGISMPSRFTAGISQEDAKELSKNLGIHFDEIILESIYTSYLNQLAPIFQGAPFDVTEENLQARIRGTLLMALSNKYGHLLLSTGNKSEMAVGYCTLYGDMNGGLAVLSDVPKTMVYRLSRWINQRGKILIPERTITREPSAELRENQSDQDSLPPYDELDEILSLYIEEEQHAQDIIKQTQYPADEVYRIIQMVDRAEYKRRQAAPSLRITTKAFGVGRRLPIAQRYTPDVQPKENPSS